TRWRRPSPPRQRCAPTFPTRSPVRRRCCATASSTWAARRSCRPGAMWRPKVRFREERWGRGLLTTRAPRSPLLVPGGLHRRVHRPVHTERVAERAPAVAPEHYLQRHLDFEARVDCAFPPRVDVLPLEDELHRIARRLLQRMAVIRISVAEHQRAAVDVEVDMHGPPLLVGRNRIGLFGPEGALVEIGSLAGAVDLEIGHEPSAYLRHRR